MRFPGALAILVWSALLAGCPHGRGGLKPAGDDALPAILWRAQLEGNPWPLGRLGDDLLVWDMRVATEGFLFPIQLAALSPQDGKALWASPVRPWLRDTGVPWSVSLASRGGVVGTWEKGDVLRTLRLADGQDAWSLPRSRDVTSHDRGLVTVGAGALWLLSAEEGRTLARHRLGADPVLGPISLGSLIALVLPQGRLVAQDPLSGKVAWDKALPGGAAAEPGALLAAGTTLLVAVREPADAAVGARLLAFHAEGGALLWEAKIPASERPPRATALSSIQIAGDLLLCPDPVHRCLRALELATGRERFRVCGLRLESPTARFGNVIYALGQDQRSETALGRGDPWYSVDFPVLMIESGGGGTAPVLLPERRDHDRALGNSRRPLRAVRLPWMPPTNGVLHLVQRNRFLLALRVGHPPVAPRPRP